MPSKVDRTNDGVDVECDGISFEGLPSHANERESARRRRRIGNPSNLNSRLLSVGFSARISS